MEKKNIIDLSNQSYDIISKKNINIIVLNIGGEKFITTKETFLKYPETLLGRIFSSENSQSNFSDTVHPVQYFFDRNPKYFGFILDWYRINFVYIPKKEEFDHFKNELNFWEIEYPNEVIQLRHFNNLDFVKVDLYINEMLKFLTITKDSYDNNIKLPYHHFLQAPDDAWLSYINNRDIISNDKIIREVNLSIINSHGVDKKMMAYWKKKYVTQDNLHPTLLYFYENLCCEKNIELEDGSINHEILPIAIKQCFDQDYGCSLFDFSSGSYQNRKRAIEILAFKGFKGKWKRLKVICSGGKVNWFDTELIPGTKFPIYRYSLCGSLCNITPITICKTCYVNQPSLNKNYNIEPHTPIKGKIWYLKIS